LQLQLTSGGQLATSVTDRVVNLELQISSRNLKKNKFDMALLRLSGAQRKMTHEKYVK
jgi:hypothetical protein